MRKLASFYFFKTKPIILKNRYERWRGVADLLGFKTHETLRVEWMVFYYTVIQWPKRMLPSPLSTSVSQGRPFTSGPSVLKTPNTMSIAWLTNLKLLAIRGTGK